MIADFYFKKWSPPKLTAEEGFAVATNVARNGVLFFTFRFICLPTPRVLSSGITRKQILEYWIAFLFYLGMVVIGAAAATWGDSVGNDVFENLGGILFAVGFLGAFVFILSVIIVALQYASWLRQLRRRAIKNPH